MIADKQRSKRRLSGAAGGSRWRLVQKLFCLGLGAAIPVAVAQRSAIPVDPAQLLIVDCLLPPEVRSVGGQATRLMPRRPIRTSANICAIRGGEYVAYDRANYETALGVWKDQAELGDADAQNYVGQIYEKGLGRSPDYEMAAQWYTKAAEQGHTGAQLSLAHLYESGLGVEQDTLRALNLYRSATGLKGDDLTYVSEVTAVRSEAQQVIDDLTDQLEQRNDELESLTLELNFTQERLTEQQVELEAAALDIESLRDEIDDYRASGNSPEAAAEIERLERTLAERELQQTQRERELAELEAMHAEDRARFAASLQVAAERNSLLQVRLGAQDAERQTLNTQISDAERGLYEKEKRIAALMAQLGTDRTRLARDREQLVKDGSLLSESARSQLKSREEQLARQQDEIAALQVEQSEQLAAVADLHTRERELTADAIENDAQLSSVRAELAVAEQRRLQAEQFAQSLSIQLSQEQDRIELARRRLERSKGLNDEGQRQLVQELTRELSLREAKLAEHQSVIDALKDESKQSVEKIVKLRSLSREAAIPARSGGLSGETLAIAPSPRVVRGLDLGKYHALIIGNNTYTHLPRLETPINDAETLDVLLREKYGFQTKLLINATRSEILTVLNEYRETLGRDDSLLIYYAGHGELQQQIQRGYWLPVDADPSSDTEWISDQMITDQIALMSARHVLVVADSCYSGVMARESSVKLVANGESDAANIEVLEKLANLRSRSVMTSGGEMPVADGGGGEHSVFAARLIATLEDNENVLLGSALYSRLFGDVQRAAAQLGVDQAPQYSRLVDAKDLLGEFVFVPST